MVAALVNFQLGQQLAAETILGNHSLDRMMNEVFRILFHALP